MARTPRRRQPATRTATCAQCGKTAICPKLSQPSHPWVSMSLRPVGPLVEACGKACLQLWIDEHTPEMDAWGVWYEGAVKAGALIADPEFLLAEDDSDGGWTRTDGDGSVVVIGSEPPDPPLLQRTQGLGL